MEEFQNFKIINSQLKKKFIIRKPDLNETKEQFNELSKELKSFKSYSGLCSLAAANCEHSLKNTNNEFDCFINSARLFKEAGNVNAAISSYRKALEICPSGKKNAYYLEFGRFFESHNRYIEAADIYKENCYLKRAAFCYLKSKLFDQAYKCYQDIEKDNYEPEDYINLFLLRLIILPIKEENINLPVVPYTNDRMAEINILLESLVLLLLDKSSKRTTLLELSSRLQKYLNGIQIDLLMLIQKDILYSGLKF